MPILGKRRDGFADNAGMLRDYLNSLKARKDILCCIVTHRRLWNEMSKVLEDWDGSKNLVFFYNKHRKQLSKLVISGDPYIVGIFIDDKLNEAAQLWNKVISELCSYFNWKEYDKIKTVGV